MSPKNKKKSGADKSGGAKIHKSNITNAPSKKRSPAKKIAAVFIVLLVLAAALLLFNKSGSCSMCKSIRDYKNSYDALSGTDTQDITEDGSAYDNGGNDYSAVTPSSLGSDNADESGAKVDNSSDASIFDSGTFDSGIFDSGIFAIFTSCGGRNEQASDSDASDRLIIVTPTDIEQFEEWEQPENAEAYDLMMSQKLDEYITLFTWLDDMRPGLSECKNAEQVENNERYMTLKAALLNWCGGAQSFSAASLGEDSRRAAELADQIAADTRVYLAIYPQLVSTGSGEMQAAELVSSIIDNISELNGIITSD